MKKCSKCQQQLSLSEFNQAHQRRDGLQTVCRQCNAARSRQYYADNKEKHVKLVIANNKKYIEERQQWVVQYLLTHPCGICGEADILVLEFDHLGDKERDISSAIKNWSLARLKTEVAKCEVLCANCHKRRTAKQYPNYKTKYLAGSARGDWATVF